jgi:hypothetical protein
MKPKQSTRSLSTLAAFASALTLGLSVTAMDQLEQVSHEPTTAKEDVAVVDDIHDENAPQPEAAIGFDLSWHTIDSGGGTSSGPGGISLSGTVGQPDAGSMSNAQFELAGGFWAGGAAGDPSCPNPADINCDGVVDGADLLILLSSWGKCNECPADLNNDGVVDGADLLIILSNWG